MGQTLDTNSKYIAQNLTNIGVEVEQMFSIADKKQAISQTIDYSMANADLVIVTGGLGPTRDDITKKVLADYFDTSLEFNAQAMEWLEELLSSRGLPMNENNRSQAFLPKACRPLKNLKGTACGMWFEKGGKTLISLPGVPFEMEHLIDTHVISKLKEQYPNLQLEYRLLKVYDFPESQLAHHLEQWEDNIPQGYSLAYLPTPGMVKLRITAKGEAISGIDTVFESLQSALKGRRVTLGDSSLEQQLGELLKDKNLSLAVAESCTGGEISKLITSVAGASSYYKGSVTAYDNQVKINTLGVNAEDIKVHGAVSQQVVKAMAEGVRKALGADYAIATSGVAGPTGGTDATPVGTVWIGVSSEKKCYAEKFKFSFTRERNVAKAASKALEMLIKDLAGN